MQEYERKSGKSRALEMRGIVDTRVRRGDGPDASISAEFRRSGSVSRTRRQYSAPWFSG